MAKVHVCYYCGGYTNGVDHVVPQVLLNRLREYPEWAEALASRRRKLLVPCCRECNNLLGSSYQDTLAERKEELKRRLHRKYKKILATPDWFNHEIMELGPKLQEHVMAGVMMRDFLKERLGW